MASRALSDGNVDEAACGPSCAKEIFFTARTDWTAQDALRMGLVNQVVPKADLERFTREYAHTIARIGLFG